VSKALREGLTGINGVFGAGVFVLSIYKSILSY